MTLSGDLAEWAAGLDCAAIPAAALDAGKMLLLDSLGCLIGGTAKDLAQTASRVAQRLSGPSDMASDLATGGKSSARDAAFINGIIMYSVGLNGYHKPARLHPGAAVIPALIAVGEWQDADGKDALAALTAGYEVTSRIGRAMAPGYLDRGFNGNGTIGTFGATACAGRLMGLSASQLANAFGINGSQAAGLQEWHHDATLTVVFHAGRAAQNAVEACILAEEGMTGPSTILEGREGFGQAYSDTFAPDGITRDLGQFTAFRETSVRPHFGATSTIAASGGAALLMHRLKASLADVESVTIRTHSTHIAAHDLAHPTTLQGARQSLQYNVAQGIGPGVLTRDVVEADLTNPRLLAALPLVRIESDDSIPCFGAEIILVLKDGRIERLMNIAPAGDPENPLGWNEIVAKFMGLAEGAAAELGHRFEARLVQPVVDAVMELEKWRMRDFVKVLKNAIPRLNPLYNS